MAVNDQYLIPGLFPFSRLCGNPGNNSSVNESNLMKLIGYRLSIVLIIYTKNASNLTNRY